MHKRTHLTKTTLFFNVRIMQQAPFLEHKRCERSFPFGKEDTLRLLAHDIGLRVYYKLFWYRYLPIYKIILLGQTKITFLSNSELIHILNLQKCGKVISLTRHNVSIPMETVQPLICSPDLGCNNTQATMTSHKHVAVHQNVVLYQ